MRSSVRLQHMLTLHTESMLHKAGRTYSHGALLNRLVAVKGADLEHRNAGFSNTIARLERELRESAALLADRC